MSPPDVEIIRELYGAYNRGGRAEFTRGVARWVSGFEPGFQYLPEELVSGTDRVLVKCRLRGRGRESGAELEQLLWHVWEVRDGRPYRCWVFTTEDEGLRAAGLTEQ